MSKMKSTFDMRKIHGPPVGQNWCWLTRELLESPAWRMRSLQCSRFIEFLMIEHLAHGGAGNGELVAPFAQLEKFGIGRRYIAPAIDEAIALKLVVARRGGVRANKRAAASRYRLTFYHSVVNETAEHPYFNSSTDDWRQITEDDAEHVRDGRRGRHEAPRKKNASAHPVTETGDTLSPPSVHTLSPVPTTEPQESAISDVSSSVTPCPTLSISREGEGQNDAPVPGWVQALGARPPGQYAGLVERLVAGGASAKTAPTAASAKDAKRPATLRYKRSSSKKIAPRDVQNRAASRVQAG